MNLNQLRFVMAVAKTGSFSKAANECCVTQPSLSNAIAQFEDELGAKFFVRTTRKVTLTPFGEHMLPYIEEVLNAKEDLSKAAKGFFNPSHKLIRIGMSPLINTHRLADALLSFRKEHPQIEIMFKQCLVDDLTHRLNTHKIDLAILLDTKKNETENGEVFYSEPLYYLPNDSHGSMEQGSGVIMLPSIAEETILVSKGCGLADGLRELFESRGLRMKEYPGQALNYQVLEEWTDLGIGSAILPYSKISKENHRARPLYITKNEPAQFIYKVIWNNNVQQVGHVEALLQHFKVVVPSFIKGLAS